MLYHLVMQPLFKSIDLQFRQLLLDMLYLMDHLWKPLGSVMANYAIHALRLVRQLLLRTEHHNIPLGQHRSNISTSVILLNLNAVSQLSL